MTPLRDGPEFNSLLGSKSHFPLWPHWPHLFSHCLTCPSSLTLTWFHLLLSTAVIREVFSQCQLLSHYRKLLSHDDLRLRHRGPYWLVRQHFASIHINLGSSKSFLIRSKVDFDILKSTSSFTVTSSPSTQTFSILTHWPTVQLQRKTMSLDLRVSDNLHPMIQESIQECCLILAPFSTVLRLIQTPSSITTPGPMVTLGPEVRK